MRQEKFLYNVNYIIDKVNQQMTIYYKDIPIETIEIKSNMSYNPINEEIAHEIALKSDLAKELIKGDL